MTSRYTAQDIEVLSGLEPVKRRPGMYTDTTRPNHLAQEIIDNSVDEALAGFATSIDAILHTDGSLEISDNGRGMPVDLHPEEKVSGVELILTRLHAGGKFSNKNYQFSGGLHGVGVSVVNALSERLQVTIKRNGKIYEMEFAHGDKVTELRETGTANKRDTGTSIRFWPEGKYFDNPKFSLSKLKHVLRAKAVLCPNLKVTLQNAQTGEKEEWCYQEGLSDYLSESLANFQRLPEVPFVGTFAGNAEAVDWAVAWILESGESLMESYVNLIPTVQGGT